jgi:single-stranded DNA-specific DHH superfamily exonuclease
MEDIILNGVSINELKAVKQKIQKDANAFVSDNIEAAQALVREIVKAFEESDDNVNFDYHAMAHKAVEKLENARLVAGVADVQYVLPYSEEYGGYDSGEIISNRVEDMLSELDISYNSDFDPLSRLYAIAESMESDSRAWNSSSC